MNMRPVQGPHTVLNALLNRYESSIAFIEQRQTSRRVQMKITDDLITGYRSGGMDPDLRRSLHKTLVAWSEQGLVDIQWERFEQGNLLQRVYLQWDGIDAAYKELGRTPKSSVLQAVQQELASYEKELSLPWMQKWLQDVRDALEARRSIPENLLPSDPERRRLLLESLRGLTDKGQEVLSMRLFSKRYLKNSKTFERVVRTRLASILRNYALDGFDEMRNDYVEDVTANTPSMGMPEHDAWVLRECGIEVTHQEISFCGPVVFVDYNEDTSELIRDHSELRKDLSVRNLHAPPTVHSQTQLDCSPFRRGLALDSDTLQHLDIGSLPVRRVLTIENKANYRHYVQNEYHGNELVVYLGGFPSPVMRQFLQQLYKLSKRTHDAITFAHWSDLDYGGILISQMLRDTVTPEFESWRMEPEWLNTMQDYVEPFEDSYRQKLEGLLKHQKYIRWKPLIEKLLEVGGTLEQESFLV